jgi:hypothetical protein
LKEGILTMAKTTDLAVATQPEVSPTPEENTDVTASHAPNSSFIAEKSLTAEEQKASVNLLIKVSSFTGAKAHTVDEFLGQTVPIHGCIIQPITLGKDIVDKETGEVSKVYVPESRTIMLLENGEVISFVSKAATSFANTFLFPLFGKGNWTFPVSIKFTQISKGQGRTYNFQVVG